MNEIEAIIFDCDGVLVDSEVIFIEEEIKFLAELGLRYDRESYIQRFMGLNNRDWIAELEADYEMAGLGIFPDDFLQRKRARTWPRIRDELQPIDGARQLIERFGGAASAASSSDLDKLIFKLAKTGLKECLEPHIYSAQQVKHGKPEPDLFLFAARQIGVEPANCLIIEDSDNGVKAGMAAAMQVVGFVGGGHATDRLAQQLVAAGAQQIFDSHHEISRYLGI